MTGNWRTSAKERPTIGSLNRVSIRDAYVECDRNLDGTPVKVRAKRVKRPGKAERARIAKHNSRHRNRNRQINR